MMKKLIAFLLAAALCFSLIPQVYAARIENSISLGRYAFSTDDNIFREFTNFGTVNIVMEPGEWTVTPAFHAIDGGILSYSGFQTESSDPDVAEARIIHVGTSPVSGVANSFIGLEIHAKSVGTTEISVNYATFVTNSRYTDNRGTPFSAKKIVVTVVDNTLEMDVSMSANEVVLDWPEGYRSAEEAYTKKMMEANEQLATKLMSDGLTAVIVGGTTLMGYGVGQLMGATLGVIAGPAGIVVGAVLGVVINCAIRVNMDVAAGRGNDVAGDVLDTVTSNITGEIIDTGLPGMSEAIDYAEILYKIEEADRNNELRKLARPTMYPKTLEVVIEIRNPGPTDASGVVLELSSENLSFKTDQGPWSDSITKSIGTIPANGSILERIPVYVKPAYHNLESGTAQQMYTGSVAVMCSYYNETTRKDAVLTDSAELPVYTRLNEQDKLKAAQFLLKTENMRGVYVACPVNVHILDREGNTLAVLTTDGEPYQDGFITAGSMGDVKYFVIPQDKKDDYQIKIVAADNGSMNVFGMDGGAGSNLSFYSGVSLKKGDSFFLNIEESVPAELYTVEEDGTRLQIDPTLELNEDTIAEALTKTDVSEENRPVVAHAVACALVPAALTEGAFQNAITLDQYAQLMLNLYEKQLDLFPGSLTEMYLADQPDAEPVSLPVAVAVWTGLLDREYYSVAMQKDAAARLLTNEEAQTMLANYCDIMEYPDGFSLETDSLSIENMICIVDALWQAKALSDKDVDYAVELVDTVRSEMTSYVSPEANAVLYYRENETQNSILRNSMIYYPVKADESEGNMLNLVVRCINLNIREQELGTHPGTPVDINSLRWQSLGVQMGYIGSGNQAVDNQGWTYTWLPFFLYNQPGSIHMNTVYLFVCRVHKGADKTVFGELPEEEYLNNRVECYVIADQEVVGNFLATQYLLDQKTNPPKNFQTLNYGSEGEAVLALQKQLAEDGYYNEEPTGVYDEQTRQAVSDFQKDWSMTPNGVADQNLQRVLFGECVPSDFALESWLAHYIEKAS